MTREEFHRLTELFLDDIYRVAVNECNSFWRKPWKRKVTYLEDEAEHLSVLLRELQCQGAGRYLPAVRDGSQNKIKAGTGEIKGAAQGGVGI